MRKILIHRGQCKTNELFKVRYSKTWLIESWQSGDKLVKCYKIVESDFNSSIKQSFKKRTIIVALLYGMECWFKEEGKISIS